MGDRLRLAIGVLGGAASFLLLIAPIPIFSRVIRKKSTEEFSCIPYIIFLLNRLIETWYGLPTVSSEWENVLLSSMNGLGILFETTFIVIYFWFATTKGKKKVVAVLIPVLLLFCVAAVMSALLFHDHHHREVFEGSVRVLAAVAKHGSSLVVVKQVIQNKSMENMSFYSPFFSFTASTLWMTYGLLGHDMFTVGPNMAGIALGVLQLVLYCKYRKSTGITEGGETQTGEA